MKPGQAAHTGEKAEEKGVLYTSNCWAAVTLTDHGRHSVHLWQHNCSHMEVTSEYTVLMTLLNDFPMCLGVEEVYI